VWALGVHALTEYPLDYAYFLLPLGLILGALHSSGRPSADEPRPRGLVVPRAICMALAAAAAALTVWVVVEYTSLEKDHVLMRQQWEASELSSADVADVPQVVVLTQLRALLLFMRTPPQAGLSAAQLNSMASVAQRFGYWPVLFRWALAQQRNGQPQQAQATLARLCKTQPPKACSDATRWFKLETGGPAANNLNDPNDPNNPSSLSEAASARANASRS
jgi:hypothetical protein